MASCAHLEAATITELPDTIAGCEDCLAIDGVWCHLRICLSCGHVGCCDDSPGKHATAHAAVSGHPLIRSAQPGEDWSWCFVDEVAFRIREVTGEPRIPPSPMGCP